MTGKTTISTDALSGQAEQLPDGRWVPLIDADTMAYVERWESEEGEPDARSISP